MRHPTLLVLCAFASSCATVPSVGDQSLVSVAPYRLALAESGTAASTPPAALAPMRLLGGDGYTTISVGAFSPAGDIDSLDTGYYAQVAFGTDLLPILVVEASVGFLSVDGPNDGEVRAVPVFVNAASSCRS